MFNIKGNCLIINPSITKVLDHGDLTKVVPVETPPKKVSLVAQISSYTLDDFSATTGY